MNMKYIGWEKVIKQYDFILLPNESRLYSSEYSYELLVSTAKHFNNILYFGNNHSSEYGYIVWDI